MPRKTSAAGGLLCKYGTWGGDKAYRLYKFTRQCLTMGALHVT